jgi:hypothetical protein
LRHVARFLLIGLYTGTRAGAIASASPYAEVGRSYVDLERGIFYRKPIGKRATRKRQTPAPIPPRLLAHLRRWKARRLIATCFVEFNGKPVSSIKKGFRSAVRSAGLPGKSHPTPCVTPPRPGGAATAIGQKGRYVSVAETVVSLTDGRNQTKNLNEFWSEWQDSNLRPLRPERSALPG